MIKSSAAEVVEVNTREEGGTVNNVDKKCNLSDKFRFITKHCIVLPPIALHCLFFVPFAFEGSGLVTVDLQLGVFP